MSEVEDIPRKRMFDPYTVDECGGIIARRKLDLHWSNRVRYDIYILAFNRLC